MSQKRKGNLIKSYPVQNGTNGHTESNIQVYGYRWAVLFGYAVITAIICIQWLTFAPIAREAKLFYNVSAFQIDLLSMVFLAVFIVMAIPASYVIDTYGIRKGVGFGAALTGIIGLIKGAYASDYSIMIACQFGLAVAQPFIINAATKVSVLWFPINERATAVALGTLAQFVGIIIVMICTPILIQTSSGLNIPSAIMTYGIASSIGAVIFFLLVREKPPTSPSTHGEDARISVLEGLRHILKLKDMQKMILLFFIGLGIFNALSTCIDQICELKGLNIDQSGLVGGVMLISGILGGVILPPLSDKIQKRHPFMILAMAGFIPGIAILTFSNNFNILLIGSFLIGFFLLGVGAPVGFQYCAEVTSPAPESSSQGLLLLIGQVSGIAFIVGMNIFGMLEFMKIFLILAILNVGLTFMLKESPMMNPSSSKTESH
ncbi:MFS transporter [Leptospira perolatii]|uniref:MFS transporter n=2 Tax=Leptospira perolatii TaxID=2023191 RepID=A0A2M9ZSY3_9LEPT|nr:MFS transporter [Leptospira perolatii]PJZ75217.1 MFS transporter [Leptospira perolatii]